MVLKLLRGLCGGAMLLTCAPAEEPRRPNIVFLFADDQQVDSIAAWGNSYIETPNLDRLAGEGFSFRSAYCAGSFSGAVCVASRSMLMTGRHWTQIEDKENWRGLKTLPEALSGAGYDSHIVGKWHNGRESLLRSFKSGSSVFIGGMGNQLQMPLADIRDGKLLNERVQEGFSSTMFADAAIEFLKQQKKDPYFLYVAFTAPHDTRNPPQKYREMYYKKNLPLPDNFMPLHPFDNGMVSPLYRDENLAPWPRPPAMIRDQIAEYYGLITHLDEQVGRILGAIKDSPDADNTYVVYTADHGLALGRHGLMGKQSLYEHSMRSPLMIRGPGVPAGKSSDSMVYLHDLNPTLLKLAGLDIKPADHTADLAPIWLGKKKSVRDSLFMPFSDKMRSIRDDRWKLIVYPQINHRQLFDLQNDPGEMSNLAEMPEHQQKLEDLTALMKTWQTDLGDGQVLTSPNPQPKEYDHTKFVQKRDPWQPDWIYEKYFSKPSEAK